MSQDDWSKQDIINVVQEELRVVVTRIVDGLWVTIARKNRKIRDLENTIVNSENNYKKEIRQLQEKMEDEVKSVQGRTTFEETMVSTLLERIRCLEQELAKLKHASGSKSVEVNAAGLSSVGLKDRENETCEIGNGTVEHELSPENPAANVNRDFVNRWAETGPLESTENLDLVTLKVETEEPALIIINDDEEPGGHGNSRMDTNDNDYSDEDSDYVFQVPASDNLIRVDGNNGSASVTAGPIIISSSSLNTSNTEGVACDSVNEASSSSEAISSTRGNGLSRAVSVRTRNSLRRNKPRFQCEKCAYSTIRIGDLNRHQSVHNTKRDHKCTFPGCERTFKYKYNLKIHSEKHTDNKVYRCDNVGCRSSFKLRSNLRRHKKGCAYK